MSASITFVSRFEKAEPAYRIWRASKVRRKVEIKARPLSFGCALSYRLRADESKYKYDIE